jgi:hypothetical protein
MFMPAKARDILLSSFSGAYRTITEYIPATGFQFSNVFQRANECIIAKSLAINGRSVPNVAIAPSIPWSARDLSAPS